MYVILKSHGNGITLAHATFTLMSYTVVGIGLVCTLHYIITEPVLSSG